MATTAKDVFDIAMGLMDEVNENSGATDTADTKEYKNRTLLILTALRGELYPYSDTYPYWVGQNTRCKAQRSGFASKDDEQRSGRGVPTPGCSKYSGVCEEEATATRAAFPRQGEQSSAERAVTRRPICPPITDFETPLGIDDVLAQTILPYGLAAQLLLNEDAAAAAFLQQRYEELLRGYGGRFPVAGEDIQNLYGGIEHGGYSRW